jgi:hypothetical protein
MDEIATPKTYPTVAGWYTGENPHFHGVFYGPGLGDLATHRTRSWSPHTSAFTLRHVSGIRSALFLPA